ncbi:putative UPF0481 protein At3g02645 isoform X2 [Rutidosis leptorrhynchoides]|uniref:putative UPF0481 protein At3g02645 isoform X2 n=1 Tax=Rutidosis leptorrhynchoides TaxID=125765 RepID=UPI003A9A4820
MTTKSISNPYSFSKMNVDEDEWVESMRKSILEHEEEVDKVAVSIFSVPNVLLATDPESYIPQQIALGPFHHWLPEVYDMQRYKLAAARRTVKKYNINFERMIETMKKKDEARIRACYHKFLDMSGDALIWMMAVDMAFLLEFLVVYSMKEEGRVIKKVNSSMSHLVDGSGKKLSHMAILRDLVMVENQIPLFLVKTMLEHQCKKVSDDYESVAKETLKKMLMGLYHELTPFQENELPDVDINECDHLLDFLYHLTVPNNKELGIMEAEIDIEEEDIAEVNDEEEKEKDSFAKESEVRRFMNYIWNILSKSNAGLVKVFKKLIFGKPMALLMKLPWKIISSLPILKMMKEPMERMLEKFQGEGEEKSEEDVGAQKSPTIEEITIPSVTEMARAGIRFSPVNGGIFDISFDHITSTLYLPVVDLDVNTEVYLRNLVAYEACVAAGPLVVARYTELMNGIIDTEDDAKFLRERGIVLNHLKSDKEVADLWNGMSKSVKLTKVPKMDKVIEDVNKSCARVFHQLPDIQGGSE